MMLARLAGFAAISMGLFLSGPPARADHPSGGRSSDDPSRSRSVLFRPAATGKARTFVTAVVVADLVNTLRDGGPYTVFVPTDEAFAKLPQDTLGQLLKPENREQLVEILTYHVVPGRILAAEITQDPRPVTANGARLTIAANGKGIAVDGATIVETDLLCRNGVVHFIDTVLMPPAGDLLRVAGKAGQFKTLLRAVEKAGLTEALEGDGPFTILAPTDEAFAKLGRKTLEQLNNDSHLLAKILKYHVLPGRVTARELAREDQVETLESNIVRPGIDAGRLTVNNSKVVATDIESSNGLIHVIDTVLLPPDDH